MKTFVFKRNHYREVKNVQTSKKIALGNIRGCYPRIQESGKEIPEDAKGDNDSVKIFLSLLLQSLRADSDKDEHRLQPRQAHTYIFDMYARTHALL